jgi:hypothetical protein
MKRTAPKCRVCRGESCSFYDPNAVETEPESPPKSKPTKPSTSTSARNTSSKRQFSELSYIDSSPVETQKKSTRSQQGDWLQPKRRWSSMQKMKRQTRNSPPTKSTTKRLNRPDLHPLKSPPPSDIWIFQTATRVRSNRRRSQQGDWLQPGRRWWSMYKMKSQMRERPPARRTTKRPNPPNRHLQGSPLPSDKLQNLQNFQTSTRVRSNPPKRRRNQGVN